MSSEAHPLDESLARIWGRAETGDLYEVAVRPHLVEELERRWPPLGLERHHQRPAGPVVSRIGLSDEWVVIPDVQPSGGHPPPLAWDQLEQSLTVFTAHRLTRLVAIHSAAIAWKGRAIVVPAASGGGKSTLAVAAAEAGATVLSDEYALVDPATGSVRGWTRPVRILRDDGGVDRLDLAVRSDPVPVGLIALIRYDPAGSGSFEAISPAEAVGRLLAHTLCARSRPDDSLDAALALARNAPAVSGPRQDARQAIHDLLHLLGQQGAVGPRDGRAPGTVGEPS